MIGTMRRMMNPTIVFVVLAFAPSVAAILGIALAMILATFAAKRAESAYAPEANDGEWIEAIEAEFAAYDVDREWDTIAAHVEIDRAIRAIARDTFLASVREGIRAASERRNRASYAYAGEDAASDLSVYVPNHRTVERTTRRDAREVTASKLASEFAAWTDREVRDVMREPFYFTDADTAHLCSLETLAWIANMRGDTREAAIAFQAATFASDEVSSTSETVDVAASAA